MTENIQTKLQSCEVARYTEDHYTHFIGFHLKKCIELPGRNKISGISEHKLGPIDCTPVM